VNRARARAPEKIERAPKVAAINTRKPGFIKEKVRQAGRIESQGHARPGNYEST